MQYKISWVRRFFKKTVKVVGHRYDKDQDKMVLYFDDGSIKEIKHWSDCECHLGSDWAQMMKKQMEQQAGVSIPTTF